MDFEKALTVFEHFIKEYDLNNEKIKLKYEHTLKVVEMSNILAQKLKLSEEDIFLAKLIGLLHDIGRFEQVKEYDSFKDTKIDHAEYGIKILFDDNLIRTFIKDTSYDKIIYNSIKYHNKLELPNNLDERTLLFCRIIRDADKMDIYRVRTNKHQNFFLDKVSDEVLKTFLNHQKIDYKIVKNKTDSLFVVFAFFFDINFKESFEILKDTNIFNNFLNSISVSDENKKLFDNIKLELNKYMEV